MNKNIKVLGLLLISIFLISGCKKEVKLKDGEQGVVTLKDNTVISINELYEKMKNNYALETLITMIDTHIFETEFSEYKDTAWENTTNYINQMLENYGSEEDFVMAIQQNTNFSSLEGYRDYIYLGNLQSHGAFEYTKGIITDKEINKYYKDKIKEDIEISHILITPDVASDASEEDIKKAETKAKKKVNDIIAELNKEKKDVEKSFEKLAKKHSSDEDSKENGGKLGRINNYNSLSSAYDELLSAAYKLKDGEYTTTVITSELGYHIILRTKTYEKESLEKLEGTIRELIAEEYLTADTSLSLKALKHYRKLYKLDILDSVLNKQYNSYMNSYEKSLKNAQKSQN